MLCFLMLTEEKHNHNKQHVTTLHVWCYASVRQSTLICNGDAYTMFVAKISTHASKQEGMFMYDKLVYTILKEIVQSLVLHWSTSPQ